MLTTSTLRDYVYLVCISVIFGFKLLYSLISNCHSIPLGTPGHAGIQKLTQNDDTVNN